MPKGKRKNVIKKCMEDITLWVILVIVPVRIFKYSRRFIKWSSKYLYIVLKFILGISFQIVSTVFVLLFTVLMCLLTGSHLSESSNGISSGDSLVDEL